MRVKVFIFYPRGLQSQVATVDLYPWYKNNLIDYFSDTEYRNCFDPPWFFLGSVDRIWEPKCNTIKSPEYVKAVNVWIYLSNHVEDGFIRRCLLMFIDMHMLNIKTLDATGVFVNKNVLSSDITDDVIPNIVMDVLPPYKHGKEKNKILHALSKALPQRCQIRNLKEIIITYVSEDDHFFHFLLQVMKNSLLGTYQHCSVRLNFKGRYILWDSFERQLKSKPFFCKWFRNGSDHQVLIFFCLKEYLIHATREAAPVSDVIDEKYGWGKFEKQVCLFMNRIRSRLNVIADREFNFLVRSDWIANIEAILINAAKQHIKLFRTTPQVTYYSKIHQLIMKHFTLKNVFKVYDIIRPEVTHLIWNVIQRLYKAENIFKMMPIFDLPVDTMNGLLQQTFTQEHFEQQTPKTLKYILEFIRLLELRKKIGLYVLPVHIFEKQIDAISKKESCKREACTHFGINYLCFICNDIKMFIMKETNISRHSNCLAKGSLRIVVNNQAAHGNLEYICGRRTERHQRHGKRKWRDNEAVAQRKLIKEKQRDAISHRCINTPLKEVDMIGHFLSFFNKMMFLCTKCGNACTINKKCFQYDNVISCSMCMHHQKKTCEKCCTLTTCNRILVLDTKVGRFRKGNLCVACTGIHASAQPIVL